MPTVDPKFLSQIRYRCIGPTRGGRVVAVAADPKHQAVFYFGAVAGGVWKSHDAGQYWENVTDGFLTTGSIGALAVAPSDGNVIYAGTGESTIRIDVTHGDGVYKSTDAGVTWRHMGLTESRHIGEIRVHPNDPDVVYVAALGHASRDNPERGLYRSRDGGENWELVLYVSDRAGAVDVSLDPNNPRIIFATIWQTRRTFWSIDSGGPDSGLWRSRDGGDTWENISQRPGMPEGILGKIGVSVSPARSGRVFAMVEAEGRRRGLYRSDDIGETWEKMSSNPDLGWRPWYYQHVIAHPTDADEVFVMNMKAWRSIDGGKTFEEFHTPHGDNHALWIDPTNPDRMIGCDDGGAWVSFNAGESWSTIYNQLTAQFYHVATDDQFPYMVYGSQQDNSSIAVPSHNGLGAINWADCYAPGTAESGYVAPKPGDPNIVYVGAIGSSPGGGESLQRYDHTTKQVQLVNVWPEAYHDGNTAEVRFQWTYPIVFSPHDSNTLYVGGNKVFRTTDEGHSWQAISPDLTYADPATMGVSGPLTMDTAGAEMYATIFSLMVSTHHQGVLMAGSDDGLLHLSTNDGGEWMNVTPPDLAKFSQVTMLAESPHTPGTIYMTAARHKMGDYAPYVYKTDDLGTTWTRIDAGLPQHEFCRVIREDPNRKGLLYVGTELGIHVSFDDGASWQSLQCNLPVTPIYDFVVKDTDLVVATHGRSFWILDDLTPLHQMHDDLLTASRYLLKPRNVVRTPPHIAAVWGGTLGGKNYHVTSGQNATFYLDEVETGHLRKRVIDAGDDLERGVRIMYFLDQAAVGEARLRISDGDGQEIETFSSAIPADKKDRDGLYITAAEGMNTFQWPMTYPRGVKMADTEFHKRPSGPLAPPGTYQATLTVGDWSMTQSFELLKDPRVATRDADLAEQFDFQIRIRDKLSEIATGVNTIRSLRRQLGDWAERLADTDSAATAIDVARALDERLEGIEVELVQVEFTSDGDTLNYREKLFEKLTALPAVVGSADARPTTQSYAVFHKLAGQADEHLSALTAMTESRSRTPERFARRARRQHHRNLTMVISDTYIDRSEAYLAGDRRRALSEGRELSDRVWGSALFADVSGFTPLTEALANELGPQRGAEELTAHLNRVFHAVIDDVDRYGGEVIYFGGDAITCWLDGDDGRRGAACGLAIQRTMASVGTIHTPNGTEVVLAIKVAVAVGNARRFVVGDPAIQLMDVLAGRLIDELADAEHLAEKGDVVLARSALDSIREHVILSEERGDGQPAGTVGVLTGLRIDVDEAEPTLAASGLGEAMVRPWILPAVYERLVTGRGEFLAELRAAYPVFVRFGGIDYDHDPDAVEKLDHFAHRAQKILSDFGGNLLHLILGDKGAYLCAVFGAPHAHEDDASRAATAAIELLTLERETAATDLQIGISHGRIRSGAYGHPMRRTFTCLGDAVNLSARLMAQAPPGHVYVSEEVHRSLSERVECQLVGDLAVKGKADPIRVLSIVGLRRGPTKREIRYPLPMVGRDSEMAVFAQALDEVLGGSGRVVGISAEAGRGKSRLIAEVVRNLSATGVAVAWGEAQNFGRTTSYMVWRDVWRTLLDVDESATETSQGRALTRRLRTVSGDHARRGPLLGSVVGIGMEDNELTRTFDAKLRKTSLESLLVDLLRARAADGALAIILEDCHWIDPLSRDLLEELVLASATLPVLFVLAYRPADAPGGALGLERIPYFQELELAELTTTDAHLLLRAKLEQLFGESVDPATELVEFLLDRAQGNPFYLEELINYVHGREIDPADPAAFRELDIPDTLFRLVQSRIDMLDEAPRTALKVASVIGQTFESPFVHGVYPGLGSIDEVEARFEAARQADILRIDSVEDRSWLFRHVVARDVAYDSLPFAMRTHLHDRVGAFLESGGPLTIEHNLDLLAYHYWLGEDDAKKREYAVRAGIAAQSSYANDAAADYFRRALPLVPDDERAGVLRRLGKVLELRGGWADAEATYTEAIELSRLLGDTVEQARAHADLAETLRKEGRFEDARQQLILASRTFSATGDDAGLGLVLHLEGTLASQQGQYNAARAAYEKSLEIRERLGDRPSIGSLLSNLALVAECEGDLEQARAMNERALAMREELGDRWAICISQNNLGMIALLQNDFAVAQMRFRESMRLATEIGDRWIVAVGHHNLGNANLGLGEAAEAGDEFLQALRAYEDYGDLWSVALLVEDMVLLALAKDELVRAAELVGAADALRTRLEAPRPPAIAATLEAAFGPVRSRLGDDESTAHSRGLNLDATALGVLLREVGRSTY